MPYVKQANRGRYNSWLHEIKSIDNKGDLEYCIFKLMTIYMDGRAYRYSNLHDTVYAAQHCADEFRRRYLDPREDSARAENGDIE